MPEKSETSTSRWLIGLLVAAAFGGGVIAPINVVDLFRNRGVVSAQRIEACEKAHGMKKSPVQTDVTYSTKRFDRTGDYGSSIFQECDWPRVGGEAVDGYAEVDVLETTGPEDSEASNANALDVVHATCSKVTLGYTTGTQGTSTQLPLVQATMGMVIDAFTGKPADFDAEGLYARRGELDVVRNDKIGLDKVSCAG